jgi:hypothetical protein
LLAGSLNLLRRLSSGQGLVGGIELLLQLIRFCPER